MAWDALAARGWHLDPRAGDGRPRLAAHDLEYFESAQYGDELTGAVWVAAVAQDAFTIDCQLSRGGQRALHARSTWQWTGAALPEALRAALQALR
jgi:acyl-CoA thioesterase FadM